MDLLRHLGFFVAVAEHRHFGNAAAALGMTQPPVSQGVQRLERHLGQRLLDRDARGVALTGAGSALLPLARQLLQDAGELVTTAHRWRPGIRVRLGAAGELGDRAPGLVASLAASGLDVVPRIAGSVDLVEALRTGELDVAVVRHPAVVDGLVAGEVLVLPTRLSGGASPPDEHHEPLGGTAPVVVPPRRHHPAAHDQLVDSLQRLGHSGAVLEAETDAERRAWAAAGHGLLWQPRSRDRAGPTDRDDRSDLPPLRLRVLTPLPAERRPGIDHPELARLLEDALG